MKNRNLVTLGVLLCLTSGCAEQARQINTTVNKDLIPVIKKLGEKGAQEFSKAKEKLFEDLAKLDSYYRQRNSSYISYNNATNLSLAKPVKGTGKETQFSEFITASSIKYNVPEARIYAVIRAESAFNSHAKSHVGAVGLMQLMPKTAEYLGVSDSYNPQQNIDGGTKYLSILYGQYNDWDLTHAAYNAGPGNVKKYNNTIPPFKETQNYVVKINSYYEYYTST